MQEDKDLQFYPTPEALARKAWAKFQDKNFIRVLEPSAGEGHLAEHYPGRYGHHRTLDIDAIEIDVSRHPILQKKGMNVVGVDFLKFKSGSLYSHILLNPPFIEGARHVLHAWSILEEGEIVAILNAETVKNPFSRERSHLVSLIEQHGEVEFIENAFNGPDAERTTDVEVALVWLKKTSAMGAEIIGDIIDKLKAEEREIDSGYEEMQAVALPNSTIENAVLMFKAAVEASRQAIMANARADHYAKMLGETMSCVRGDEEVDGSKAMNITKEAVKRQLGKSYSELKDRAWTSILMSSNVMSKLSSAAQSRLEREFETIKKLEFSVENIHGFLLGLAEKQGEIQMGMVEDVFDRISAYHTENVCFYRGWKSNNAHRTMGMSIKAKRFILPHFKVETWSRGLDWDARKLLSDFDKVFAMMDGKREPEIPLTQVVETEYRDLVAAKRISSSYFDIRLYKGIGTMHFFPRDKKLIDRLNRLVGSRRKWLPPEGTRVSEDFWLQHKDAERFDKEFRDEVAKQPRSSWNDPFWAATALHKTDEERRKAQEDLAAAMDAVLNRHGINPDAMLEADNDPQLRLLAA